MEFLNYTLAATASFLGLIFGLLLAFASPEELEFGRPYFMIARNALLAMIAASMVFFYVMNPLVFLMTLLVMFFLLYKLRLRSRFTYPFLGLFVWLTLSSKTFFALILALVFLYGLPEGTLWAYKQFGRNKKISFKNKKIKLLLRLILEHLLFLVAALGAYLASNLL